MTDTEKPATPPEGRGEPLAYLRTYPRDGSRFLAFASSTGPLPPVQKLDNGTIIHNTPLYP